MKLFLTFCAPLILLCALVCVVFGVERHNILLTPQYVYAGNWVDHRSSITMNALYGSQRFFRIETTSSNVNILEATNILGPWRVTFSPNQIGASGCPWRLKYQLVQ